MHRRFRKIRICESKKQKQNKENILISERVKLKKEMKSKKLDAEMKEKIEQRIKEIEEDIGSKYVDDYHKEIIKTIEGLGGDETALDGSGRRRLWTLLKRKFPKNSSSFPVGKKDRKGNLITNHEGLKKLY